MYTTVTRHQYTGTSKSFAVGHNTENENTFPVKKMVQPVQYLSDISRPVLYSYRKISNIRRTESPNLNVSRLVLQLSLPDPVKPCVQSRMKM